MPRSHDWLRAALDRARAAADDVAGNYHTEPWRFLAIGDEAAAAVAWLHAQHVEQQRGAVEAARAHEAWRQIPGWIVVTCALADDPAQAEHLQERCLTAVQRFALSLWAEDVHTRWTQPAVKDDHAFTDLLGIDPAAEFVIGVLWYSEDPDLLPPTSSLHTV